MVQVVGQTSSAPDKATPDKSAERAQQEIDYGRRGKDYIFGAFSPSTGEAFALALRGAHHCQLGGLSHYC